MPSAKPLTEGAMIAIAHKVINFADDLAPATKKVAAALLEHRNRTTGRCDPSVKTLAGMCGISERTVKRANENLSKSEIFIIARHGGLGNRNLYSLNFAEVARRNLQMQERKARARWPRAPPKVAPDPCREWPLDGARIGAQTYNINPSEETYGINRAQSPCLSSPISSTKRQPPRTPSNTPDPSRKGDTSWPASSALASLRNRTSPVRDTSFSNAALQGGIGRWDRDLREFLGGNPEAYGAAIEMIDDDMCDGATEREMKRHGDGIRYLVAELAKRGLSRVAGSSTTVVAALTPGGNDG